MLCQKCGFSNTPTAKFCKQCGQGLPRTTTAAQSPTQAAAPDIPTQKTGDEAAQCPQCATPRVPGKRFCRSCRFDFVMQPASEAASITATREGAVTTLPEVAAVPSTGAVSAAQTPQARDEAPAATGTANPVECLGHETGQGSETRFTQTSASVPTSNAKVERPASADHRTAGASTAPVTASGQGGGGNNAWIVGAAALVVIGLAVGGGLLLRAHHRPVATENAAASVPAAASAPPPASTTSAAAPAPTTAGTSPDAASTAAAATAQAVAAPAVATAATQNPQGASPSETPAATQATAASAPDAPAAIAEGPQVMTNPQDIKLRDCAGPTCATLLVIPKGTRLTIDPATIKIVTDRSGAHMPWARISYEGMYCPVGTNCRHLVRAQMAMDGWLDVKSLVPLASGG
jgi:hypothetical protein